MVTAASGGYTSRSQRLLGSFALHEDAREGCPVLQRRAHVGMAAALGAGARARTLTVGRVRVQGESHPSTDPTEDPEASEKNSPWRISMGSSVPCVRAKIAPRATQAAAAGLGGAAGLSWTLATPKHA